MITATKIQLVTFDIKPQSVLALLVALLPVGHGYHHGTLVKFPVVLSWQLLWKKNSTKPTAKPINKKSNSFLLTTGVLRTSGGVASIHKRPAASEKVRFLGAPTN